MKTCWIGAILNINRSRCGNPLIKYYNRTFLYNNNSFCMITKVLRDDYHPITSNIFEEHPLMKWSLFYVLNLEVLSILETSKWYSSPCSRAHSPLADWRDMSRAPWSPGRTCRPHRACRADRRSRRAALSNCRWPVRFWWNTGRSVREYKTKY